MIGDAESSTAVIVDPQRDIDEYLKDAEELKLEINHVFLTHFHADFISGHLELRDKVGAFIHMGSQAKAEYAIRSMKDGDVLEFGKIKLKVLETPGHTPESISIVVYDMEKNKEIPHAVLTGDTLFIGDVGRPDLRIPTKLTTEDLGGMLYDSIHEKLLKLPDDTLVYPAHGAGSLCGKNMSKETVSKLGVQRQYNYALQPMDKNSFIEIVTAEQEEAPDYFTFDAVKNTKEHPSLEKVIKTNTKALKLAEVLKLIEQEHEILDVRDHADYAGAHFIDSINIGLNGKFSTWAGTILMRDRPIIVIADHGQEEEAVLRLGRIGFDHVAGYLDGGMGALKENPEFVSHTDRITPQAMAELIESSEAPAVIDIRAEKEWLEKRIPHSQNFPLNRLRNKLDQLPDNATLIVHCQGGYRSSIAISLMLQHRKRKIYDLVGGISAWSAAKLPALTD